MTTRPNFLFIITDQHRADHLGCTGHPVLKTPRIDSIAEQGVLFERFYVSTPVCMPNRATLMTGRMPSVHGVRHNGIPLSRSSATFVELLQAAGYRTALFGKSHLQTQTGNPPRTGPEPAPEGYAEPPDGLKEARKGLYRDGSYDQELPSRWNKPGARVDTPFYGFDDVELMKGHGPEATSNYKAWLKERHPDPESLLGEAHQLPHDYTCPQAWRTALPEELYPTSFLADRVETWLGDRAATGDDAPFFASVSFLDPHHPFTPPGRYWDMYKPDDMPVPAAFEANDWAPPPHVQALIDAYERGDPITDRIMAHGVGLKEALEARALTCGSIAAVDAAVGRILDALDQHDLRNDTVVIFTSDHGEHLGDHRLLLKGLAHYDELVRVPFLWSDPEIGPKGAKAQALSGTIDISATILDRVGLQPYNGMQGRSFRQVLEDPSAGHRSEFLVEDENQRVVAGLGRRPRERTLVTDRWRMSIFQGHDWGELYDLDADPGELVNLWDDADCRAVRSDLMERLARAEMEVCDRSPGPLHQA